MSRLRIPETAALMNEKFVNIKVDREERPDLDAIYMDAVQAMTGQGGWPMSVWLTPDGRAISRGHLLSQGATLWHAQLSAGDPGRGREPIGPSANAWWGRHSGLTAMLRRTASLSAADGGEIGSDTLLEALDADAPVL